MDAGAEVLINDSDTTGLANDPRVSPLQEPTSSPLGQPTNGAAADLKPDIYPDDPQVQSTAETPVIYTDIEQIKQHKTLILQLKNYARNPR